MPAKSRRSSLSTAGRQLARLASELRLSFQAAFGRHTAKHWVTARRSLEASLQHEVPPDELADIAAQGIACGLAIAARYPVETATASQWLLDQAEPWERAILERVFAVLHTDGDSALRLSADIDPAHLYEHFLQHYARQTRRRTGVFFTPQPIAKYILRKVERLIVESQLPRDRVHLLDPASE